MGFPELDDLTATELAKVVDLAVPLHPVADRAGALHLLSAVGLAALPIEAAKAKSHPCLVRQALAVAVSRGSRSSTVRPKKSRFLTSLERSHAGLRGVFRQSRVGARVTIYSA